MTYLSYKSEMTSRYRDLLVRHGLHIEKLGLYAVRDLQRLREGEPMASKAAMRLSAGGALGKLILRGLAVYEPETKTYTTTSQGKDWLVALQMKGLLEVADSLIKNIEAFREANP